MEVKKMKLSKSSEKMKKIMAIEKTKTESIHTKRMYRNGETISINELAATKNAA